MSQTLPQLDVTPSGKGLAALVEALRLQHWVKNAFVLAPLLFSARFTSPAAWAQCLCAVAVFCLLSSSTYLINDVCDRQSDLAHPVKRRRPIASGRLSVAAALVASAALGAAGIGLATASVLAGISGRPEVFAYRLPQPLGGLGLLVWAGCYLVANLLYSFWLKERPVVDVLVVSMGFVLRAMAGAAAIAVPISPWLVVCTLTLCLFIALCKRRSEIAEMPDGQADVARKANRFYEKETVEHMLTVSVALTILTYSLYCLAPRTVSHIGSGHMIWTIPLVIYGTFRYYRLTRRTGSDIVSVLIGDRVTWIVLMAYVVMSVIIIRFGSHAAVRSVLDV